MEGGLLSLKWNNHRSSFLHVLSSLRKQNMFADVTIACGGKFYPTHKLVLSTCSEYFQEMFQQTQCKHPIIVLKDIHCEELEALLNYMYIGEVNVIQENLSNLIKSAECLKIKGLAVPDDPPPKGHSNEKRNLNHCYSSENKRKRSEEEIINKEQKCQNLRNSATIIASHLPASESVADVPAVNSSKEYKTHLNMKSDSCSSIKVEPIDFIEIEDTKQGILSSSHSALSSSRLEASLENLSESQNTWGSENDNINKYSVAEESESAETEDSSLRNTVWRAYSWSSNQRMKKNCIEDSSTSNHRASTDRILEVGWSPCKEDAKISSAETHSFSDASDSIPNDDGSIQYVQQVSTDSHYLTRNMRAITAVYPCTICDKVFDHKGNFRKHMMTHTGERPFKCDLCEYSSSQKGNLHSHMKRMHPHVQTVMYEPLDYREH